MVRIVRVVLVMVAVILFTGNVMAEKAGKGLTAVSGMTAPDFELMDSEEEMHHLSDYRGKPVIVNFWATWCPPCRAEMPSMQRAWEVLKEKGVMMLAINVGEDEDMIFPFTAEYPVEFPLLMDLDSSVTQQWGVRGLPTTYVVNPDGEIVYRAVGGRDWDSDMMLNPILDLLD